MPSKLGTPSFRKADADIGGRIQRKRVSFRDDEVKTKEDRSGMERV